MRIVFYRRGTLRSADQPWNHINRLVATF